MAFKLAPRTRQYVTSTGVIDVAAVISLGGITNIDLNTFVQSVGDGNQTAVCIVSGNGVDWQECFVTVDDASPDTLTIDEIIQTSIAGVIGTGPITLTGTSRVFGIIITDFQKLFDKLFGSADGVMVRDSVNGWYGTTTLRLSSFAISGEDNPNGTTFVIENFADSQNPVTAFPFIATRAALGTEALPLAVSLNARLGGYGFYGYQGGDWRLGASIQAYATENWTGSARGANLLFSVTPIGSIIPVFPLELTETELLLNGVPVGSGGGSTYDFDDLGAWSGASAYAAGNVISYGGKRYLASADIDVPTGTPGRDGLATIAAGSGINMTIPNLSTTGTADTICVISAWNHDGTSITGIASDSSLVFTLKSSISKTLITGHRIRAEIWTAPSPGALVNEDIVITYSNTSPSQKKAVAFGVFGGDISLPFDANANALKTTSGDRTAPGVTAFSTTTADDLIIFIAASDSDGGAGLVANTAPTNFTLISYQGNAANDSTPNVVNLNVSTRLVSATQSAVSIADGGDPSCWVCIAIALKASGAANISPTGDPRWVLIDNGDTTPAFASTDLDAVLGSTRGAIPYRGASGWTSRNPGSAGYVWTSNGTGADPDWAAAAGGAGVGGNTGIIPRIYRPTKALSGFSSANLQGTGSPTLTDTEAGMLLTSGSANGVFAYRAAPSTPYEWTGLFAIGAGNSIPFFGFSDGTKYQVIYSPGVAFTDAGKSIVISYNSIGSFNSTQATIITGATGDHVWLRISDDGTNVAWKYSADGVNFFTIYTIAKASGFLGGSGYTRIVIGGQVTGGTVTVISLDDGTGTLGTLVTGSDGLWRSVLSAKPTSALTGLTTWVNQGGATVADRAGGITISAPTNSGDSLRGRYKAAPATPYFAKALIGITAPIADYSSAGFGWYDGTKFQTCRLVYSGGWKIEVVNWTNSTTYSSSPYVVQELPANPVWIKLSNDGINITIAYSISGDDNDFVTLYSAAIAGNWLSAYTNIVFLANRNGTSPAFPALAHMLSYVQG